MQYMLLQPEDLSFVLQVVITSLQNPIADVRTSAQKSLSVLLLKETTEVKEALFKEFKTKLSPKHVGEYQGDK